jgi:DNA-binding transcriptional ArsR family regulator
MMVTDNGNMHSGKDPVQISDWVQANRPKLHPTRRKVLAGVAQLSQGAPWTTSSEVRKEVGISQQLLNRHLRALEGDGLVELENQGPGLPLQARITSAGLRALGLRGPQPAEPSPPSPEEPRTEIRQPAPPLASQAMPAAPARTPDAPWRQPAVKISRKAYVFLERVYGVLAPFLKNLDRRDFYLLTAPAMHKRPVVGALFEALSQYLPGLRAVEFKEIVASLTGLKISAESKTVKQPPWPGKGRTSAGGPEPPELSPAESALEDQLSRSMNPAYKGMDWHQRTRLMGDEWDRALRRRMGLFRTKFTTFGPRWERDDWNDFNQARRQADHRGADYAQWVAVQFDRLAPEGEREVEPSELHGEGALAAYLEYRHEEDGEKGRELGQPPYTAHSFSTQDPSHVDYARRLIAETTALAARIMGSEPQGPARLLAQAARSGALPIAALDLAPLYRQEVLTILQGQASQYQPIRPAAGPQPKVII